MKMAELGQNELEGEEVTGNTRKLKRVLVGAGARVLFYPTLLYNVVRNKIEAEFRWWDRVDQFLLFGAVPFPKDVPRLKQLGVRGVITLNESYETLVSTSLYNAYGIDHLVIPTRDYLFAPSLEDIGRAVDFIHKNASHGRTTYVHCKAGRGRSTTIVLCYLAEHKHMTPDSALQFVQSIRPRVLLARSQRKAVQEYWKRKSDHFAIPSCTLSLPSSDEVLITDEDLVGYGTGDTAPKEILVPGEADSAKPPIRRLSFFFTSSKFSRSCLACSEP
ncbi:hypothetical protein H6P81_001003 [Aristolochia fimbriata]|uniref:phosphatidylglycerophosphatase n=1 Tax=Aristolochia fimbriata TaxID=158543 RepID=A0AAV7F5M7_ARIFI|nr:hypothetical protein H6P81_001003 [Aristolochia fimbriata]